jgi:hypothetical protein
MGNWFHLEKPFFSSFCFYQGKTAVGRLRYDLHGLVLRSTSPYKATRVLDCIFILVQNSIYIYIEQYGIYIFIGLIHTLRHSLLCSCTSPWRRLAVRFTLPLRDVPMCDLCPREDYLLDVRQETRRVVAVTGQARKR